jgi:hypothetical protein
VTFKIFLGKQRFGQKDNEVMREKEEFQVVDTADQGAQQGRGEGESRQQGWGLSVGFHIGSFVIK